MTWRMARALDTLLAEINAAAPKRSKVSDGGIGDAAHASSKSDHNPNAAGVVRARDFTHDPAGGCDAGVLAAQVVAMLGTHPALGAGAYVIYNRRICSTSRLSEGWRYYGGVNAHQQHVHVSVGYAGYDSTAPWGVLAPTRVKILPKRIQTTIAQITREITRTRAAREVAKAKGEKRVAYTQTIRTLRLARKAARQVPKR